MLQPIFYNGFLNFAVVKATAASDISGRAVTIPPGVALVRRRRDCCLVLVGHRGPFALRETELARVQACQGDDGGALVN